MSAKEKANEIFDKMYQNQETTALGGNHSQYGNARRCSLLLVDEISFRTMKLFKYGISVFDSRLKKYGGFNHFIAGKIFRWRLCYLDIYIKRKFKFEIVHNDDNHYYDGYHNHIWVGWVLVSYGT